MLFPPHEIKTDKSIDRQRKIEMIFTVLLIKFNPSISVY